MIASAALLATLLTPAFQTQETTQRIDVLHPMNYVDVYELQAGDTVPFPIFCNGRIPNDADAGDPCPPTGAGRLPQSDVVLGEVDKDSRLLIRFNRSWIVRHNNEYEGAITIRAKVIQGDKESSIDVPGYSVFGEAEEVAAARIRSSQDWRNILAALSRRWSLISDELDEFERRLECDLQFMGSTFASDSVVAGDAARDRFGPLIGDRYCAAVLQGDLRTVLEIELGRGLTRGYEAVHPWIRSEFVRGARATLLANREVLQISTSTLAETDSTILTVISRLTRRDPSILRHLASSVSTDLLPQVALADSLDREAQLQLADSSTSLQRSIDALEALRRLPPVTRRRLEAELDQLRARLVTLITPGGFIAPTDTIGLRLDAEFQAKSDSLYIGAPLNATQQVEYESLVAARSELLDAQPAEVDREAVTIQRLRAAMSEIDKTYSIIRCTDVADSARCADVVEEGGVPVIDSLDAGAGHDRLAERFVTFLKDTDIHLSANRIAPGDVVEIEIHNGEEDPEIHRYFAIRLTARDFGWNASLRDSFLFLNRIGDGRSPSVDLPADTASTTVDFAPVAGVTYAATYYARSPGFWRMLTPGVGINVSFPRFGELVSERSVSGTPAVVEVKTNVDAGSPVDVAVGGVITLFDNRVSIVGGRTITARRAPWFIALGFSFVRLAQGGSPQGSS